MNNRKIATATGLLCFLFFLAGLSPGVSLQDGGELTAAVFGWGVPHPPGYPLYTLLAKFWISFPLGNIAYRMNLFSAVLAALAGGVLYVVIQDLQAFLFKRPGNWAVAMAGTLFAMMAPLNYRQSILAEVYSLNTFLCVLMLLCLVRIFLLSFELEKDFEQRKYFFWFCLFFGLTMSNHHTSWVWAPLSLAFGWTFQPSPFRNFKIWPSAIILSVLGLAFYLYLPLAAARDPALNWGDPQTVRGFLQHVFRFQYAPHFYRSSFMALEQVREQVLLMFENYNPVLLGLGILGLVSILDRSKALFSLFFGGLLLTGPITALVTNFEYPFFDRIKYEEVRFLVSVFFIPQTLFWGVLMAIGFGFALGGVFERAPARLQKALPLMALALALAYSGQTVSVEGKRTENAAENVFSNWEKWTGGRPALIIANWDPFFFPSLYFQKVEGRGGNLLVVDTELMRMPWYLKSLQISHPVLMGKVQKETQDYLAAMTPFMEGNSKDISEGLRLYSVFLNALIDRAFEDREVYLAIHRRQRLLPAGVAIKYKFEPQWILTRLVLTDEAHKIEGPEKFDFSGFGGPTMRNDYVLREVGFYHIQTLIETSIRQKNVNLNGAKRGIDLAEALVYRLGGQFEDESLTKKILQIKAELAIPAQ